MDKLHCFLQELWQKVKYLLLVSGRTLLAYSWAEKIFAGSLLVHTLPRSLQNLHLPCGLFPWNLSHIFNKLFNGLSGILWSSELIARGYKVTELMESIFILVEVWSTWRTLWNALYKSERRSILSAAATEARPAAAIQCSHDSVKEGLESDRTVSRSGVCGSAWLTASVRTGRWRESQSLRRCSLSAGCKGLMFPRSVGR